MNGSKADDLWRELLSTLPAGSDLPDRGYEAWSFGDNPEMADRLGGLVLAGRKTATCSALWELEAEGEPVPRPGEMSVVLDGGGEPLCIIETTEVEVRRFDEVDEAFARYSEDMPLVCERFRVVYGGSRRS